MTETEKAPPIDLTLPSAIPIRNKNKWMDTKDKNESYKWRAMCLVLSEILFIGGNNEGLNFSFDVYTGQWT